MIDVPVYNMNGEQTGTMQIDEDILGGRVRISLLKQAVVAWRANQRQGSARTKSRGMVEGSTRKLYRQKGTGNARMGNVRTCIRRGGGVGATWRSSIRWVSRFPKPRTSARCSRRWGRPRVACWRCTGRIRPFLNRVGIYRKRKSVRYTS